jgi:uncharacterized protein YcnI
MPGQHPLRLSFQWTIFYRLLLAVVLTSLFSESILAHATLEVRDAVVGAPYKATIKIGHGCDGAATTRLQVKIPAGVIGVKPMPKPGWSIATVKSDYGRSYNFYHGAKITAGVTEITWSDGTLADEYHDEFVFSAFIADSVSPGSTIYFPVVQTCEKGEHRWVEIPAAGQDAHALKSPAPALKIIAAKAAPPLPLKTYSLQDLVIETPWTRATPSGSKVAGGYLHITNRGSASDRVIGGTLAPAGRVEIHEMAMTDGILKMRQLAQGLEIKPGETVELKPGGYHMMFMDLTAGLTEGQRIRGTLVFEKSGTAEIEYAVAPIGAQAPGQSHH